MYGLSVGTNAMLALALLGAAFLIAVLVPMAMELSQREDDNDKSWPDKS
jgi:hypothetical protein